MASLYLVLTEYFKKKKKSNKMYVWLKGSFPTHWNE